MSFQSLFDPARNNAPEGLDSRSTSVDDINDFNTANGGSPAPAFPVASPTPLLHSALNALGSPTPAQALNLDDVLRPLPQRRYPIPPVVNRTPANNLQELEERAAPPLYPQEQPSQSRALGRSLFGFLGRIPGIQTLGNTVLTQLGLVRADLPAATAPRLPQIQNPIPALLNGTPDHIAIDIRPGNEGEIEHVFIPITEHNPAPTSAFSQLIQCVQQFMNTPQPILPTHQPNSNRNQEIYQQLGIQRRPNPLATILGEGQQLSPARVRVTYSGRTAIRASAQGDRDMVQSPNSRPPAQQLTPYEAWHQTEQWQPRPTAEALPRVGDTTSEPPTLLQSALAIGTSAVHGVAKLVQNPHGAGEDVRKIYADLMAGFAGAPAAPQQPATAPAPTSAAPTTFLDLTDVLPAPTQQAASATAPSLMDTATTLLGGIARVIQNPDQAGRDLRTAATDLVTGFTGGERRDPAASAAATAPAEADAPGFFSQIFTGLKNAATKQATEMMLVVLHDTLARKAATLDSSSTKKQIQAMIAAIESFQRKEILLDALQTNLTQIMDGLDASGNEILHILLNGFEVPIRIRKPGQAQDILDNIQNNHPLQTEVVQINVEAKQAQLVNNISTMAPINIINEWFCGGHLKPAQIARILGSSDRQSGNYHSAIRKEFFRELDKLPNLFWVKRWAAKFTYWVFSGSSNMVLSSFIKGLLKKIEDSVQHDTAQRQQELHTSVIRGINTGIGIYNDGVDAVKNARRARPADGDILSDHDTMLGNELARTPYNGGETKDTLYNKAIDKAVNEILPPLGWTKFVTDQFDKLHIAARMFLFPVRTVAWICVGLTELTVDFGIRTLIRKIVKSTKILDSVIELSVNQVARNGYSHAINKLILQQLKLIGEALNNPDAKPSTVSVANRNELKTLARALFTTVEKQRREAQVDTDVVTTLENVRRSAYELTKDLSADAMALIIDQTKNILLDPKMMQMRQDALLEALNAALESTTTATEPEMVALEQEIQKQSDIILNKALKQIVHKTLQNTPEQVGQACKVFTDKLKNIASNFVKQMRAQLAKPVELEASIAQFTATMRRSLDEAQNDPILQNYAETIDRSQITPIARLLGAIAKNMPKPELEAALLALETGIQNLPEISHLDTTIVGSVMENLESITSRTAFMVGKEFFNEAWALLTKKPVWRFAAHRTLLAFISS